MIALKVRPAAFLLVGTVIQRFEEGLVFIHSLSVLLDLNIGENLSHFNQKICKYVT